MTRYWSSGLQSKDCPISFSSATRASGHYTLQWDGKDNQGKLVKPGKYTVDFAYRTSDVAAGSGVHWEVVDAKSNTPIATSSDLSSEETQQVSFSFTVGPDAPLVYLRLAYRRPARTERTTGTLIVQSIAIATGR